LEQGIQAAYDSHKKKCLYMKGIIYILLLGSMLVSCSERKYSFEIVELNTNSESSLRAICAVDENIVWASGSQGQVLLTLDGGENWKQMMVPECDSTEFRSLHAWDDLRALVFDISPQGRAFMTSDGGKTWELVYASSVSGAFFNSLKFADAEHGIAISDPVDDRVFILRTTDGGHTWHRLETTPPAVDGEIIFAASNTCIEYLPSGEIFIVTGGSKARVLSSRDHGNNWDFTETPAMSGETAGLFSVSFTSIKKGVAVGGDFNKPDLEGTIAIFTEDGGKHWHPSESMPAAYRSCVVSFKDELIFATGKTGSDYSSDAGKNWTFIDSAGYYAASIVPGSPLIYLSGSKGSIARVRIHRK
jgi:photosystem II stability/assembly factor-like uncharacterized protein